MGGNVAKEARAPTKRQGKLLMRIDHLRDSVDDAQAAGNLLVAIVIMADIIRLARLL